MLICTGGGHQTWENKNRSIGLLGCRRCVLPQYTSPSAVVAFQPVAFAQLPHKTTSEDLYHLSEHMKAMNKNPSNLFYRAQPHSAISLWLTVNTATPDFQPVM